MPEIRHPEWYDSHDDSRFPFVDTATLTNTAGDTLFPETFLDAALYPLGAGSRLYLSQITVSSRRITLVFGDELNPLRASTSFDPEDPPSTLAVVDTAGRPAGILVSEPLRLAVFRSWSLGTHEFLLADTELAASVCIPTPESGVRGLQLDDGQVLTGDVWLVGDDGIVLTCETGTPQLRCEQPADPQFVIRVHAVGDPLFRRRLCPAPDYFQAPQFLQQLCFVSPGRSSRPGTPSQTSGAADIFLLTDTTGSMAGYIDTVKIIFPEVVNTVLARFPSSEFYWGAADYRDFEDGGLYVQGVHPGPGLTPNPTAIYNRILAWLAQGGGDSPEQNLAALQYLAENWEALGGRSDAPRAIIWAGDVPGWEAGSKGYPYPTLQATLEALTAANILLFGVNLGSAGSGIDAIGPGASAGLRQASTLIGSTGGSLTNDVSIASTSAIAALLIDAITQTEGGVPGTPALPAQRFCCGPGDYGDIKISVGSQDAADTILRVRPAPAGLIIETVG